MRIRIPNAVRDAVLGNAAVGMMQDAALDRSAPHVGFRRQSDAQGRAEDCASTASARPICGWRSRRNPTREIEEILAGVWDNLGRHRRSSSPISTESGITIRTSRGAEPYRFHPATQDRFIQLRDDGKPALVFAAHLANWEMPALPGAAHGLPSAAIYRAPNIGAVADMVLATRGVNMGQLIKTGLDGAMKAGRGAAPTACMSACWSTNIMCAACR